MSRGPAIEANEAAPRGAALIDRQLRLAMFSPLPTTRSGIATYLVDLLPLLPAAWKIDLFGDEDAELDHDALEAARPGSGCYPHTAFAARHAAEPYDLNVYQVGNSSERNWMLDYVIRFPGLLVLHDGVLHPARLHAATEAGDMAAYRRIAAACRPDVGSALGHLVAGGLGGPALFSSVPMCEDLVRASLLTAMHSEMSCGWLRGLIPEAEVSVLNHWRSVDGGDPSARRRWRRQLGGDGEVIVGSFGNIGAERRLDRVFAALAGLQTRAAWCFAVVGSVDPRLGLQDLARGHGIDERISWHPQLDDTDFVSAMGAVDFAVNLRYPPVRASSGVLHQLLGLGVPAIISDVVHWRDYPEPAVARVPPGPDGAEHETLVATLSAWIDDAEARAAAAATAAAWAAEHLTPERMRDSYVAAVAEALRVGAAQGG